MTFTKNLQWCAIVSLLFMSTLLSAQGNYVATPANYISVAQDISHHYPVPISIPTGDIADFILDGVTVYDPCNGCDTPELEVLVSNEQEIVLDWEAVPDTDEYQLRFLNLNTGNISYLNTHQTNATISGKPNGFYAISLVAFVKENGDLKSSFANIIILEKPVLMPTAYDGTECDCLNTTDVQGAVIEKITANLFHVNYDPIANERYHLILENASEYGPSSIIYVAEQESPFQSMDIFVDCVYNIPEEQDGNDNTIWGPGFPETQTFSLKITPGDYNWIINGFNGWAITDIDQIKFRRCIPKATLPRDRIGQNALNVLQIYPNPAIDQLTIKQDIALDRPAELRITNTLGQILHFNDNFSGKELLSVSSWPAGTYFAAVAQNGKNEQQTFTVIR